MEVGIVEKSIELKIQKYDEKYSSYFVQNVKCWCVKVKLPNVEHCRMIRWVNFYPNFEEDLRLILFVL